MLVEPGRGARRRGTASVVAALRAVAGPRRKGNRSGHVRNVTKRYGVHGGRWNMIHIVHEYVLYIRKAAI